MFKGKLHYHLSVATLVYHKSQLYENFHPGHSFNLVMSLSSSLHEDPLEQQINSSTLSLLHLFRG